jgi:hypothetical protein
MITKIPKEMEISSILMEKSTSINLRISFSVTAMGFRSSGVGSFIGLYNAIGHAFGGMKFNSAFMD